jgi:carbonic anhydrase/acetyltransferase-like protein (isoleucine patch superfamily)
MTVVEFNKKFPKIHETAYISPRAFISGDVEMGEMSSAFDFASIRGDYSPIRIGSHTNVQDGAIVHCGAIPCRIGNNVTVGHSAVVHGATIGSNVIIGFNSSILDGVRIGDNVIVGAGAVVTAGTVIENNKLVVGNPAKVVKELDKGQLSLILASWKSYEAIAQNYKKMLLDGTLK